MIIKLDKIVLTIIFLLILTSLVFAEDKNDNSVSLRGKWLFIPNMSSATLSLTYWEMVGSTGHSWHDGTQTIVTFWKLIGDKPSHIRCHSYFNKSMLPKIEECYKAVRR